MDGIVPLLYMSLIIVIILFLLFFVWGFVICLKAIKTDSKIPEFWVFFNLVVSGLMFLVVLVLIETIIGFGPLPWISGFLFFASVVMAYIYYKRAARAGS